MNRIKYQIWTKLKDQVSDTVYYSFAQKDYYSPFIIAQIVILEPVKDTLWDRCYIHVLYEFIELTNP